MQLNKRVVHRQMDAMGMRAGIRAGTELCALGIHQQSMQEFITKMRTEGLTTALQERDEPFGDYRTTKGSEQAPPRAEGPAFGGLHCCSGDGRAAPPRGGGLRRRPPPPTPPALPQPSLPTPLSSPGAAAGGVWGVIPPRERRRRLRRRGRQSGAGGAAA